MARRILERKSVKLIKIWLSATAWQTVYKLKKNPKLSYRMLKYQRKVERELRTCEKAKDEMVYEIAGVDKPAPGDAVACDISGDAEKMIELNKRFNEFLQGDSDLELVGMTLEEFIEQLGDANVISEEEIELLEPFFTSPA